MKKKILGLLMVGAVAVGLFTNSLVKAGDIKAANVLSFNMEATAACESVGWWNNDGNCVNNGSTYFCKTDTWSELTDCKL